MDHKEKLVAQWLQQALQSYPEASMKFLTQRDSFRNPIGRTLQEGLAVLFDGLVQSQSIAVMQPSLDSIIKIRAVQDVSAGGALAFIFLLKRLVRTEFPRESVLFADEMAALDGRVDELVLLAFDLFVKCREQIFEIKVNENKRRVFLSEKIYLKETAASVNKER
jgi:hypothetical protein